MHYSTKSSKYLKLHGHLFKSVPDTDNKVLY